MQKVIHFKCEEVIVWELFDFSSKALTQRVHFCD
jgi:hypothetical protein